MGEVVEFRARIGITEEEPEIDLLTAVDVAIRDLRDISARWYEVSSRTQADECLRMLERAFRSAITG
jgi:hypothetical protein